MLDQETITKIFAKTNADKFIKDHDPRYVGMAPDDLNTYRVAQPHEKHKLQSSGFFNRDDIQKYLKEKWDAESYNMSSYKKLYEFKEYVKYLYPEKTKQLNDKISEFKDAILNAHHPYSALRINFDTYENAGEAKEIKEEQQILWEE